ncbi:hypothetical protein KR067_013565, partial [Drosophila pandora]
IENRARQFKVLCKMTIPKIIAKILLLTFKFAQWMGLIVFNIKGDTVSNINWLVWLSAVIRLTTLCVVVVIYPVFILEQDLILKLFHAVRFFVFIYSSYFIVKLQLYQSSEIIKFVKRFLGLLRKTRLLSRENEFGFERRREYFLMIIINVFCFFYEPLYRLAFRKLLSFKDVAIYGCFTYVILGTDFFYHFHILAYFFFGYLYSELNGYVHVSLKPQLRVVEPQLRVVEPQLTLRAQRKLKRKLKKCLHLHKEIFEVHKVFQRFFQYVTFFSFLQKTLLVESIAYNLFIELKLRCFWHQIAIGKHVLELFLLTHSVDIARDQFSMIRWIYSDIYTIGHFEELHIQLDMFYTRLNLYELRIRPWGLFDVSNQTFLLFMSALISWLVYLAQYNLLTNSY